MAKKRRKRRSTGSKRTRVKKAYLPDRLVSIYLLLPFMLVVAFFGAVAAGAFSLDALESRVKEASNAYHATPIEWAASFFAVALVFVLVVALLQVFVGFAMWKSKKWAFYYVAISSLFAFAAQPTNVFAVLLLLFCTLRLMGAVGPRLTR